MEQQFKDAKWVAETLGLPLQRIYDLTRKQVIPAVRILRQYRYDPEALAEWAKRGGTPIKNESATAKA
jgi:excisionase family DNA binding protein